MKMRKIISAEEQEKKNKRNRFLLGGFLVFIMLFSTLGYSFQSNTDSAEATNQTRQTQNYNGFDFVQQNGFWVLNQNETSFVFVYHPSQIENVNADKLNSINDYKGKTLYLKSDSVEAESEIRANLRQFVEKIEDLQNQTCDQNSVIITTGNESKISRDKNCVFIFGKSENLVQLTDEFLFKILGVKE